LTSVSVWFSYASAQVYAGPGRPAAPILAVTSCPRRGTPPADLSLGGLRRSVHHHCSLTTRRVLRRRLPSQRFPRPALDRYLTARAHARYRLIGADSVRNLPSLGALARALADVGIDLGDLHEVGSAVEAHEE
jgi:hypothetical protein